mmetsp:Transcript_62511/g.71720  ORF Transcript_62511/g.71720 Transcript_62511/m.71720 type:complete len:231 (-) Transcript_62511:528-1220(-)
MDARGQFHNVKPRTRNERARVEEELSAQAVGGDNLEHVYYPQRDVAATDPQKLKAEMYEEAINQKLNNKGDFYRENFNSCDLLTHVDKTHGLSDGDRLARIKYDELERAEREQRNLSKQQIIDKRRVEQYDREYLRWEEIENQEKREKERTEVNRKKFEDGTKVSAGQAFNPITHEYDNTSQGQQLRQLDHHKQNIHQARMQRLDYMQNKNMYNPLTGEVRKFNNPNNPQ